MRQITMTYDSWETRSLDNINLDIRRGEAFALLGPRGAGKSTALKILAGRLRPMDGKVKVFGRSPQRSSIRARIGYLPQRADDPPGGLAGLAGFLRELLLGRKRAASSRRSDVLRRPEHHRQGLAQAFFGNHELVILDEPFSTLDADGCREVKELIWTLTRRGTAVVFSSGSLSEANDVCSRAAILQNGKLQAVGTVTELLATRDGIRFVGSLLPLNAAERVLQVIREELARSSAGAKRMKPAATVRVIVKTPAKSEGSHPTSTDTRLSSLMKTARPPAPTDTGSALDSPVDYQRLERLTKPPRLD